MSRLDPPQRDASRPHETLRTVGAARGAKRSFRVAWSLGLLGLSVLSAREAAPRDVLPTVLQGALLAKVLQNNVTVQAVGLDVVPIVLLTTPQTKTAADQIARVLKVADLKLSLVDISDFERIPAGAVVFLPEAGSFDDVSRWCEANRILTVSPVPGPVKDGLASIGIVISKEGRPEVLLHAGRLAREGHELSEGFLKIVRRVD